MGLEPLAGSDVTDDPRCICENCEQLRAANALHFECFKSRFLASLDAELQNVILSWPPLPDGVKSAIEALIV
jgi:hypothetical protein